MPVNEEQLRALVASALHLAGGVAALRPEIWDVVIPSAISLAESDVLGILHGRGYSDDQILMWPGYEGTIGAQALYWALVKGGGLQGADATWVDRLDQRERLETLGIEALPCGPVGWGYITSPSRFLEDDPARHGEAIRRGALPEFKKW